MVENFRVAINLRRSSDGFMFIYKCGDRIWRIIQVQLAFNLIPNVIFYFTCNFKEFSQLNSQCQVFTEWSYSWTALVFFLLKTHALKFQKGIATRSVSSLSRLRHSFSGIVRMTEHPFVTRLRKRSSIACFELYFRCSANLTFRGAYVPSFPRFLSVNAVLKGFTTDRHETRTYL